MASHSSIEKLPKWMECVASVDVRVLPLGDGWWCSFPISLYCPSRIHHIIKHIHTYGECHHYNHSEAFKQFQIEEPNIEHLKNRKSLFILTIFYIVLFTIVSYIRPAGYWNCEKLKWIKKAKWKINVGINMGRQGVAVSCVIRQENCRLIGESE